MAVWENDPKKRNVNKTASFFIPKNSEVNEGDYFFGNTKNEPLISTWTIEKIVERRPSQLSTHDYVTCIFNWSMSNHVNLS